MNETKNEIIFNEIEKNILDNNTELSEIGFAWRVSKEDLNSLSKANLNKLKQVLSTNKELQNLIWEIENSSDKSEKKEEKVENENKESPQTIEKKYRSEGFSDLYILSRMLERWYIPNINPKTFKDSSWKIFYWKLFSLKDNVVWNKTSYFLEWGPFTSWAINSKTWIANVWLDEKVKNIILQDIDVKKAQVKEFLWEISSRKLNIDKTSIEAKSTCLENLEKAYKSWNIDDIKKYWDEYLYLTSKPIDKIAKQHWISLVSSKVVAEKIKIEKQLQDRQDLLKIENERLEKINKNWNNIKNLWNNAWNLNKWDYLKIEWKINKWDYIEFEIIKKNPDWTFDIKYNEYQIQWNQLKNGKAKIKFSPEWNIIDWSWKIRYEWSSFEVKSKRFWILNKEISEFETKKIKLSQIETELKKTHPDRKKINKLNSEFEALHWWKWKKLVKNENTELIKLEKTEIEKVKKELEVIEKKIESLKQEAKNKLSEIDKKAWKDQAKVQAYRDEWKKIIDDINKEIVELNKKWLATISELDHDELLKLSKESKAVKWIKQVDKWADTVINSKWWKIVAWFAVLSLVWWAKDWVWEMLKNWVSKENMLDWTDIAIWFIPVAWWVYDLIIAARWKDLNDRDLSTKERWIRTWFWVVGLIPWGWLLVKWWAKVIKWAAWVKMIKAADVWLEWARVAWKIWTYGYLGYSVAETTIPVAINLYNNLPEVGKNKKSIPIKE